VIRLFSKEYLTRKTTPRKRANPPSQANNFTPMNASQLNGVAGGRAGGNGGGMLAAGGTSFRSSGPSGGGSRRGIASNGDGGIAGFSGAGAVSLRCNFCSSAATRSVSASIV
jgi:hypothetical protein